MPWRKWQTILNSITGKRDTGFNEENEKPPTSNIQHPEKHQAPVSKHQAALQNDGTWILDLLWMLDVGGWRFWSDMPPPHGCTYWFAFSRKLANQLHLARQPLLVHR